MDQAMNYQINQPNPYATNKRLLSKQQVIARKDYLTAELLSIKDNTLRNKLRASVHQLNRLLKEIEQVEELYYVCDLEKEANRLGWGLEKLRNRLKQAGYKYSFERRRWE